MISGWLLFALTRPWGPVAAALALLAAIAWARGWSARSAILLGLVLQQILSCGWGPFPQRPPVEGKARLLVVRRVAPDKCVGRILNSPDGRWTGAMARFQGGRPGDTLVGAARISPPRPATVPGGFDELQWAASAGLDGRLVWTGDSVEVHRGREPWTQRVAWRIRHHVSRTLHAQLDPSSAALWTAAQLADLAEIPAPALETFKESGLFHLLAVSGFHMAILGGGLVAFLSLLRMPRRVAWILAALSVLSYAWLLGAPPSVARTAGAFAVLALAVVSGKRSHPGNSLFLAMGILVASDPNAPFRMGVQMTFAAAAGILWLAPALRDLFLPGSLAQGRTDRWLLTPLLLSISATLAVAPILAWHTGEVPWIGIPAGLACALAFSTGYVASLAVVLLSWLPHWCCVGFAGAAELSARLVWESALRAGSWRPGSWIVGRPEVFSLGLWYAALLLLAASRRRKLASKAWVALALLGLVSVANASWPHPRTLRILFLDVGQGSAALVRWPSGRAWLVDAGPRSRMDPDRNAGSDAILPAMREEGISRLDLVSISHADQDHWGGLGWLWSRIPPATLLLSADSGTPPSPPFDSLVSVLAASGWTIRRTEAGQVLAYGDGARCEIVSPGLGDPMPRNQTSLVLRLCIDSTCALLPGDADSVSEAFQLESGQPIHAQVVAAGHHGSKHSSSLDWLRRAAPSDVVLSYGTPNHYGHPNPEALARMDQVGARLWRTPEGSVDFVLDGERTRTAPWNRGAWRGPWRSGVPFRFPWT
ncbi:MAG TPA: ComEC/Rec2 family competence protein [Fibrobacteria bacterium]|nr:ComEC/Rec2 family competence protein [Fibrobacteria bacterium]